MKKKFIRVLFSVMILSFLFAVGCGKTNSENSDFSLDKNEITVYVNGESEKINVMLNNSIYYGPISWVAGDSLYLKVYQGEVTGLRTGANSVKAIITYNNDIIKLDCIVNIKSSVTAEVDDLYAYSGLGNIELTLSNEAYTLGAAVEITDIVNSQNNDYSSSLFTEGSKQYLLNDSSAALSDGNYYITYKVSLGDTSEEFIRRITVKTVSDYKDIFVLDDINESDTIYGFSSNVDSTFSAPSNEKKIADPGEFVSYNNSGNTGYSEANGLNQNENEFHNSLKNSGYDGLIDNTFAGYNTTYRMYCKKYNISSQPLPFFYYNLYDTANPVWDNLDLLPSDATINIWLRIWFKKDGTDSFVNRKSNWLYLFSNQNSGATRIEAGGTNPTSYSEDGGWVNYKINIASIKEALSGSKNIAFVIQVDGSERGEFYCELYSVEIDAAGNIETENNVADLSIPGSYMGLYDTYDWSIVDSDNISIVSGDSNSSNITNVTFPNGLFNIVYTFKKGNVAIENKYIRKLKSGNFREIVLSLTDDYDNNASYATDLTISSLPESTNIDIMKDNVKLIKGTDYNYDEGSVSGLKGGNYEIVYSVTSNDYNYSFKTNLNVGNFDFSAKNIEYGGWTTWICANNKRISTDLPEGKTGYSIAVDGRNSGESHIYINLERFFSSLNGISDYDYIDLYYKVDWTNNNGTKIDTSYYGISDDIFTKTLKYQSNSNYTVDKMGTWCKYTISRSFINSLKLSANSSVVNSNSFLKYLYFVINTKQEQLQTTSYFYLDFISGEDQYGLISDLSSYSDIKYYTGLGAWGQGQAVNANNEGKIVNLSQDEYDSLLEAGYNGSLSKKTVYRINKNGNGSSSNAEITWIKNFNLNNRLFELLNSARKDSTIDLSDMYLSIWAKGNGNSKYVWSQIVMYESASYDCSKAYSYREFSPVITYANGWFEFKISLDSLVKAGTHTINNIAFMLVDACNNGTPTSTTLDLYSIEIGVEEKTSFISDNEIDLSIPSLGISNFSYSFDIYNSSNIKMEQGEDYTIAGTVISGLGIGDYRIIYNISGDNIAENCNINRELTIGNVVSDLSNSSDIKYFTSLGAWGQSQVVNANTEGTLVTLTENEYNQLLEAGYTGSLTKNTVYRINKSGNGSPTNAEITWIKNVNLNDGLLSLLNSARKDSSIDLSDRYLSIWAKGNGNSKYIWSQVVLYESASYDCTKAYSYVQISQVNTYANGWFDFKISLDSLVDTGTHTINNIAFMLVDTCNNGTPTSTTLDLYSIEIYVEDKTI